MTHPGLTLNLTLGAGDLGLPARLAGEVELGPGQGEQSSRRMDQRTDGRTESPLGSAGSINSLCGVPFVDQRASREGGLARPPGPGPGAPSPETSSGPGGIRPGQGWDRGWLEECKDFCILYINKTLIPMVVQAGPGGSPHVHHSCGLCAASRLPWRWGRLGKRSSFRRPGLAALLWPHSGPAQLARWGSAGLRPGGPAAAQAGTQQCPGSRPPGQCRTAAR